MFRIFVTAVFAIFTMYLAGQDTVNLNDLRGRKQGFWRKSDSSGHKVYEGHFKDGKPTGEFHYFYPDGKIKTVSFVSKQGERAVTTSFYPNGKKMAAGIYVHEKKDSTWRFFSEYDGSLASEEQYKEGKIDGVSIIYFPEGGLSELRHYKLGILDGLWEQYYQDGKIRLRGYFKAGTKEGPFKTFYNSGQITIEGQYFSGHQHGTWTYYNEKGVVVRKEIYVKGALIQSQEGPGKTAKPKQDAQ